MELAAVVQEEGRCGHVAEKASRKVAELERQLRFAERRGEYANAKRRPATSKTEQRAATQGAADATAAVQGHGGHGGPGPGPGTPVRSAWGAESGAGREAASTAQLVAAAERQRQEVARELLDGSRRFDFRGEANTFPPTSLCARSAETWACVHP